jgi:hypothetical protein
MESLVSPVGNHLFARDEPAARPRVGRRRYARRWIVGGGIVGLLAVTLTVVGVGGVLRESWRKQCRSQLGRIGAAFIEYQEAHGHFPAPALARRDGTPLLSWRVELLPQLGYRALYERFHRDEPWDSPHNRSLLKEMPLEFACPASPGRRAGLTRYLVVVGPATDPTSVNTPFEPTRGVDLREITDGASVTVLVFETDTPVPWTKPDDLRWAQEGPLPRVASPHPGGAHVLLADGTVRFIAPTIDPKTLLAILTINGSEVLSGPG